MENENLFEFLLMLPLCDGFTSDRLAICADAFFEKME